MQVSLPTEDHTSCIVVTDTITEFLETSCTIFFFPPPKNAMYLKMLFFLVHKIFTFYINDVLKLKCSAAGPLQHAEKAKFNTVTHKYSPWPRQC